MRQHDPLVRFRDIGHLDLLVPARVMARDPALSGRCSRHSVGAYSVGVPASCDVGGVSPTATGGEGQPGLSMGRS
jgi:hypothetical protein